MILIQEATHLWLSHQTKQINLHFHHVVNHFTISIQMRAMTMLRNTNKINLAKVFPLATCLNKPFFVKKKWWIDHKTAIVVVVVLLVLIMFVIAVMVPCSSSFTYDTNNEIHSLSNNINPASTDTTNEPLWNPNLDTIASVILLHLFLFYFL